MGPRRAAHDRIDAELSRWFATCERDDGVAQLLAAGIPAAPVLHPREAATNPQMRARAFFELATHPVTGAHELPGLPMRFSGVDRWYDRPAPTLGQHTEEVLRDVLGLAEDDVAELRRDGIIGDRPSGT